MEVVPGLGEVEMTPGPRWVEVEEIENNSDRRG